MFAGGEKEEMSAAPLGHSHSLKIPRLLRILCAGELQLGL